MFVHVETRNGRAKFQYTISTPYSTSADAIDPNLPTVLWFHPFAFPYVFHPQFSDPLLRQFNLVAFSFRAHGETEGDILPECYGVPEATEDALAFMDAVNLPECHFVAMDYGSSIALRIAMSHPNRVISLFIISQTCIEEPRETLEGHQQLYDTWVASLPSPTEVDEERAMEAGFGFAQLMFSNKMSSLGRTMFNIVHPMAQKNWGTMDCRTFVSRT
ncbi:hypothetical protein D9757_015073 [Collybiopsis confluens]|uniref:AB hydrolase-1 domain-containing protein n=1 Tax=Collybiopsis confluens TaxID=2823264 RepID=A0A8H5D2N9_9AGAR|nr:hypothetical protein D9757_015073 [Collybiopsis confluens]